jgi:hypothetical protein
VAKEPFKKSETVRQLLSSAMQKIKFFFRCGYSAAIFCKLPNSQFYVLRTANFVKRWSPRNAVAQIGWQLAVITI